MRVSSLAALLLAFATSTAGDAPRSVPVWVVNPGERIASPVPVRTGIPLPAGFAAPDAPWGLQDSQGARYAAQVAPIERWPDGSVRWLAVDVVLPAVAPGRTVLSLVAGPSPPAARIAVTPGPPLLVRSDRLAIRIAPTGAIAVRRLGTAAREVTIDPILPDTMDPETASAARVATVSAGPLRAEIQIVRDGAGGLESSTRVIAWAGSDTVLLRHRIVNRGRSPAAPVATLPVAVRSADATAAVVLLDGQPRAVASATTARFAQLAPDAVTGTDGAALGTHLDGAVLLRGTDLAVGLVVPEFWQAFPKAIDVAPGRLTLDLMAGGRTPVMLGVGAARTHAIWLEVSPPSPAQHVAALARRYEERPRALASPAWARATGAAPHILDGRQPDAAAFLARLRSDALRYDARGRYERWDAGPPGPCSARSTAEPHRGFFGVLNWGDWNFPGYRDETKECDAWGNLEYDLPFVFGLAWASTGDPVWATWFDRALAHYRDVDIIHAAPAHPDWVGLNHPHKVGHFDLRARGTVDLGHVWLDGLLLHHRLEGDADSLAAAMAMARRLATLTAKARNPRQFGWPMIALSAAADASGDARLRDAAMAYARLAMTRFPPDPAGADWKIGVLASGLAAVHRLTGDPAVARWLLAYGERLLARPDPDGWDPRVVAVAGYLATIGGDPKLGRVARAIAATMPLGTWGKVLAMHGRVGFELLAFAPGP